jgi:hypothetical protein
MYTPALRPCDHISALFHNIETSVQTVTQVKPFKYERDKRELPVVQLQLSVHLPRGISTGSSMNRVPWFLANQKIRRLFHLKSSHF